MRICSLLAAILILASVAGPVRAADPPKSDVNSLGLTATYEVFAEFEWDARRASVSTLVEVSNNTRWPASTIAFNLSTLRNGNARLGDVTVDGIPVSSAVHDQTVLVSPATPLMPGETTSVGIEYTARFNASANAEGDDWEFARIGDVLTAYRWIPWLSRTTPFNRPNVGDPFVTNVSPSVVVEVKTDRAVTIASSGRRVLNAGLTQRFAANNVRDFNLAASPSYSTRSVSVAGTEVTFYYRTLPADGVLSTAADAIRDYTSKIGPYPHDQLTIAEIGPWSPFESPAHFWLPSNASNSLLPWMVAHEVAHQWFYSAVGNDQAREPFSDEAVSDYLARNLINRFVSSPCPPGRFDHTIYDIAECYPWVIYVQGDAWLRDLKQSSGGRFWRALSNYYRDYRGGMGGNRALLTELVNSVGQSAVDYERFPYTYPARVVCVPLAGGF